VAKTITIELSDKSIRAAIKEINQYKAWVLQKEEELRRKLASIGVTTAFIKFNAVAPSSKSGISVRFDDNGSTATIYAEGEEVAFIEFGTGIKYGYGHPEAGKFGFGPGTWEGKGHWDDPNGWWYGSGKHTYGNPPAMAMYTAVKEITENVTRIAREVFGGD
jgi:hypothetical protein